MKPLDNQKHQEKLGDDPMFKLDEPPNMEAMEDQLWAIEASVEPSQHGLMGTKLELPPLRKGPGAPGIKAKFNPDRQRTMIGDRSKTPSMAPTQTHDLDQSVETPDLIQVVSKCIRCVTEKIWTNSLEFHKSHGCI